MTAIERRTWIVVADAGRARILRFEGAGASGRLHEEAAFENPDAHGRARDFGHDRPGRVVESVGGAHHAVEPRSDPHRRAKTEFARLLAAHLDRAAGADAFDRLVVVAPARMLGDLRAAFGEETRRRIVREVDKDLTRLPARELAEQLHAITAP